MPNDKMVQMRYLDSLLTNEDYKKYYELKQEVINQYPPLKERSREQHREYIKRVGDLIWDIHGPFQRFVDSQVPEDVTIRAEKKANPKKPGRVINEEDYYE